MKLMKIGSIAERLGIDQKTIRFYERKGLLRPYRNRNNYRLYSKDDVAVLHFIISARAYRLSLRDIGMLLEQKHKKGEICSDVTETFTTHLKTINEQISQLRRIRRKIKACLKKGITPECCRKNICDIVQGGRVWKKQN